MAVGRISNKDVKDTSQMLEGQYQRRNAIGSFIGLLPGLGGAMADWLAYGATVASNPKEKFGERKRQRSGGSRRCQQRTEGRLIYSNGAVRYTGCTLRRDTDGTVHVPGH